MLIFLAWYFQAAQTSPPAMGKARTIRPAKHCRAHGPKAQSGQRHAVNLAARATGDRFIQTDVETH